MPEDVAPDDIQDKPDASTDDAAPSDDGTTAPESTEDSQPASDDWKKNYDELRPEYTRTTQELSQARQVIDLARQGDPQALEYLGLEAADEDDDEYDLDADEPLTRAEFERWQEEQNEAIHEQEARAELADLETRYIDSEFERLDPKGEFSDDYKRAVVRLASDYEDEDGIPDLEAAHQSLRQMFEDDRKQYVKSKRTAQVASGASASHQPNLDDPEERRAYMAQRFADMQSAE